ncbi:hypothetical protein NLI96_g13151 [Meripilus lineatus]|uniref:Uncharacterized protein n=1 Tax=Meripilus lineatus TaxID=2056292 RepID=A0AAD5UNL2_9APHY|nr:hypothetical protein NLI96_g13151 [Physisporinus lineatus]
MAARTITKTNRKGSKTKESTEPPVPSTEEQGSSKEGQPDNKAGEDPSLGTLSSLTSLDDNSMGNFRYSGTRRTTEPASPSATHPQNERGDRSPSTTSMRETALDDSNPRIMGAFIESPQHGLGYVDQGRPAQSSTPKAKAEGDHQSDIVRRSPNQSDYLGGLPGISSVSQRGRGLDQSYLDESREVWSTPEPQTPSERRRQRIEDSRTEFANIFEDARQAAEEFTRASQELIASHRYSANEQAILAQSRDRAMSAIAEANRMANLYNQASQSFHREYQSTTSVERGNLLTQTRPESNRSSSTIRRVDYTSTPTIQRRIKPETDEELRDLALGQVPQHWGNYNNPLHTQTPPIGGGQSNYRRDEVHFETGSESQRRDHAHNWTDPEILRRRRTTWRG